MTIRLLRPSEAESYRDLRRRALAEAPQFVGPWGEREAASDLAELTGRLTAYPKEGIQVFGCFPSMIPLIVRKRSEPNLDPR
jgi:hypothetical protein